MAPLLIGETPQALRLEKTKALRTTRKRTAPMTEMAKAPKKPAIWISRLVCQKPTDKGTHDAHGHIPCNTHPLALHEEGEA